ncbi:DegQ family serine endoprotease [Parasulfuritortus cantonensis]|uniref:Probable periplasmic serine endoprotease DegP-like n=1 Tax=Parasulfuritortus cantonensis TaxID=2528202 RepID=A0A4R1BPU8_9PROT|nr:DegQ family serine endoprotease [Parasulfuritortus cantonensis]TCJ19518.1 DegQ family serine endoprotease [Parasulfuritortus cantonensis]
MKKCIAWIILAFGVAGVAQAGTLPDFTDLVEKQSPSVVNITTTQDAKPAAGARGNRMPDEMAELFKRFGMPDMGAPENGFGRPRHGQGSGFIVSSDGYILTNTHVVDGADEVTVKLPDRREFRAKVIGSDEKSDVALLKIKADHLPKVAIGDPDKLKVGEWVLAIGAPFGFENSVTAGIVSAKGRALPHGSYTPFIQTDVAVNPGNSGGPLFNMRGEVVGMNSQIISRSGGYMGLSFAIPIDVAMEVAEQIKAGGKVSRGRLGVMIQEVTADLADSFGLGKPRGALVSEVEADSPAEKAGIKPSDIILGYDGKPVDNSIDLPRMVAATKPGSQVVMSVWRKGATRDVTVKVGEADAGAVAVSEDGKPDPAGLAVSSLRPEQKTQLNVDSGVLVEESVGAAARAGIRPGDVIVAAGNQPVNSAAELSRAVNVKGRKSIALLIKRGDGSLYIPLRLD